MMETEMLSVLDLLLGGLKGYLVMDMSSISFNGRQAIQFSDFVSEPTKEGEGERKGKGEI